MTTNLFPKYLKVKDKSVTGKCSKINLQPGTTALLFLSMLCGKLQDLIPKPWIEPEPSEIDVPIDLRWVSQGISALL